MSSIVYHSIILQLDSATSLIQAAKNLMNAVVYAVKASYVASTKYKGRQVGDHTTYNLYQLPIRYQLLCKLYVGK